MSRVLAPLLSRTTIDEVETQHDAVGRLIQAASNECKEGSTDALNALRNLLLSPRLGVVSKACHGLVQLLEARDDNKALDVTAACSWVLKAIESIQGRELNGPDEAWGESTVHTLVRCLISICRVQARRKPEGTVGGVSDGDGQGFFSGVVTSLLSMNRGALHPTVLLEGTAFLGRSGIEPVEVLHVVGPLAAAVLLQPEYSNLRGGFLLKLSVALAAASDAVRLSVLVFLTELLGFCAVHTAAHADVAGAWCGTLTNVALSLESDGAWDVASGVVSAAIVSLIIAFREHGMPISCLLRCLLSLADADPICLVDEVAFLGLTALHSPSVDDRKTLLRIIGSIASAMPGWSARSSEEMSDVSDSGSGVDVRMELWSVQALVYPVVCMAAAGNTAASTTLPAVDAALSRAGGSAPVVGRRHSASVAMDAGRRRCGGKLTNRISPVALAGRRLCALEGNEDALVECCKGLQVRAEEARRADVDEDDTRAVIATTRADLESAFFVLSPLLLRPGPERVYRAVCAATVALVRTIPALGVRLLPFVLYAVRRLQGGVKGADKILVLLEVLPELGRHKVAARPVAGVIQGFARATQTTVRAIGVRLASSLICTNSRTFTQLQGLLVEAYESKNATCPEEADESRLSRAAGMLKVCSSEPELALDFVRSLQACLGDSMSAVAALALRAIAALCRFDCLDFDAALRIVSKKGKVAHMGAFAPGTEIETEGDWGDGLVMTALAELCGAGAEAAAAAREEDEEAAGENDGSGGESGSGEEPSWGMGKAVDTLLSPSLRRHPNEKVRAGVYKALCAHLPELLKAERLEEAGDATMMAPRVRSFVWDSLVGERSPVAREGLESAASVVLADESAEPSTWVPARRTGSSKGGAALGGRGSERVGPSNRLLATLPTPETVLQTFRYDASSSRGLAGGVLWCYPPAHTASSARSSAKRVSAQAQRDEMISDLAHLLSADDAGEGLGVCPWQRMAVPLGVQRYVKRLLAACIAAESDLLQGDSGFGEAAADGERSAVMTCRRAIKDLRGVSRRLVELCSASLVSLIPNSLAHFALEEADHALDQLRASVAENSSPAMVASASRGIMDSGTGLPGDELIPLCAALATRALPMSAGSKVVEALGTIQAFARDVAEVDKVEGKDPVGDGARAIAVSNDGVLFWSTMSVGVASEWACRNPIAPEAKAVVFSGARYLLEGLGYVLGSEHLMSLAEQTFGALMRPGTQVPPVVSWSDIDVGSVAMSLDTKIVGRPTTSTGSRCLAIFAGLSSVLPGLGVAGMHRELLQVFNVIRALQDAGVCGASLCLPTAVSECLSCGIIDSPAILGCISSLSLVLDSARPEGGLAGKSTDGNARVVAVETSGVRGEDSTGNVARSPPPQDAWLGLAGLMVACEGHVLLPPEFAEAAFDKLRNATIPRRGGDNGFRVASMFAMGSLFGCPILVGEFRPRRMRISSLTSRRMVELVLGDIEEAMNGTSIRARNAAARVWGCLSALGQDERCESDPALLQALGWTEDGSAASASLGGSGGPTGLISANALHVAREGSLMDDVLATLQRVATKGKLENGNTSVSCAADKSDSQPTALFAESALKCLQTCATSLRVPHPQMAVVIGALFRGGHGPRAEAGCIDLAVKLGCKEQVYSSWLRGLLRTAIFRNMMYETRSHLLSVFADLVPLLPAKITSSVVEEISDYLIAAELQAGGREAGVRVAKGNPSESSDGYGMDAGCRPEQSIDLAIVFLSGLEQVATRLMSSRSSTGSGSRTARARDPASSAILLASIKKATTDAILPALIFRYTSRYRPRHELDSMPRSEACGGGQPVARDEDDSWKVLWDSVVSLVRLLPREEMESAIAFEPDVKPSRPVVGDSVDQAIRAYLIARLAGGQPLLAVDRNKDGLAGSPTQSRPLGSVLRWATRSDTDWEASASVLPHLARAVKFLPESLRNGWLRRILDIAGLSETCPVRAFALLGGTAAAWEPSNLGSLVVGEEADSFVMTRSRMDPPNITESPGCVESGVRSRPRREPSESSARLFSMSVAAPKAVMRLDKISAGVAGDMLARMLRASARVSEEKIGAQAEEVRLCIIGFIKGMRHALPVVGRGTLSGQFAVYSRSVSTETVARVFGGGMGDLPKARYARGTLSG